MQVIHGDLKPANVLLTAQYNVKLCDFGSASSEVLCSRLADSSADGGWAVSAFPSNHSTAHDPARKPTAAASRWYCAPESLLGGDRSEASDIWAFGKHVSTFAVWTGFSAVQLLRCHWVPLLLLSVLM